MPTVTAPSDTAVESVGARLRRCRQGRGWSQTELAARAGVRQDTISKIESGAREGMHMELETAWRLAWALGTSIDVLAGLPELRG
jgi:transcriptional regulator with XRE-family HTH domain